MILIVMLELVMVMAYSKEECKMKCSNVIQHVCGMSTARDGTVIVSRHHNICYLNKIKCRLRHILKIEQIPDEMCHIGEKNSRRVLDFGIVGAHQACNHTCPIYCVDTYEPVCAQIWKRNSTRYNYRAMVNHCHVDLFSCSVGVNVTITPLGKCFTNAAGLLFMSQMAAMKSLHFLDGSRRKSTYQYAQALHKASESERFDQTEWEEKFLLRRMLRKMLLKRFLKLKN